MPAEKLTEFGNFSGMYHGNSGMFGMRIRNGAEFKEVPTIRIAYE